MEKHVIGLKGRRMLILAGEIWKVFLEEMRRIWILKYGRTSKGNQSRAFPAQPEKRHIQESTECVQYHLRQLRKSDD